MALVNAYNLKMSFSDTDIFSDVSFEIGSKDKIGLIGVNGAGKTTLFKIFTKEYQPSDGNLFVGKDTVIGYMEQHACSNSERSMYDELLTVFSDVIEAEKELEEIASKIDRNEGDTHSLITRQQYLYDLFERRDGLTYKSRARSALIGLGFDESDFSLPCSLLSGGQRSKVSLAKLLLSGANLLLLDEPTNHLDIQSISWLENFISEFNGSAVIISHDRYFLDRVSNRTFELERGKLYTANGNYSRYIELKNERRKAEEKVYEGAMKEIHRIEGIIEQQKRFNRERNYKTVASKQKQIDRIEKDLEKPESELSSINFRFETNLVSGNEVLTVKDVSKAFDSKKLFENADLLIRRGERVFITGENGCGKSTFLKVILGKLRRDSGKVILGVNVKVGYFDQTLAELSNSSKTVLDEVWDSYRLMNEVDVRRALAAFLFKGEDVFKSMSTLSGGEKARVALLKLMLSGSNFLILDDPTNHLDIKSREALEAAFDTFDGTMLVVSHDRYFINRLATRVIRLHTGGIDSYDGNYDYYCEHCIERNIREETKAAPKENTYKKQKELDSLIRRTKGKISRLEAEIDSIDEELEKLQEQINDPGNAADYEKIIELTESLHNATEKQEEKMLEWQELNEELEKLENS